MATKKQKQTVKRTRITAHRRQRMNEALDYRLQGFTFRQIAEAMKISASTAHDYVNDALKEIPRDNAEAVLAMQLERYDMIIQTFLPKVIADADNFAASSLMQAMRSIERLTGVESPIMRDAAAGVVDQLTAIREAAVKHFGLTE